MKGKMGAEGITKSISRETCESTVRPGCQTGGGNNFFLQNPHPAALFRLVIVESLQVQQPVDQINAQLVVQRRSMGRRLSVRGFHTEEDFPMLKSDHVGRPVDL